MWSNPKPFPSSAPDKSLQLNSKFESTKVLLRDGLPLDLAPDMFAAAAKLIQVYAYLCKGDGVRGLVRLVLETAIEISSIIIASAHMLVILYVNHEIISETT